MHLNTPGANVQPNGEREMYTDFKVRFGIERPEDSNLIFSPEAAFRRNQVVRHQQAGYPASDAYKYANHIGRVTNLKKGR